LWHQSNCSSVSGTQSPVPDRQDRSLHTAALQVPKQRQPTLRALPVAIDHREQLLTPVLAGSQQHQRAQPVLFETDVEVHPIGPDVHVVPVVESTMLELPILVLPLARQPADVGRRQTRSVLAKERAQSRPEIAGRQAPKVEHRQNLGHLGRAAHVGRQDRAGEALALPVLVLSSVVDSRSPDLERPGTAGHLPRPGLTVANDQTMTSLVEFVLVPLDVRRDFLSQRTLEHSPGSFTS
jgi:hypothetical protein